MFLRAVTRGALRPPPTRARELEPLMRKSKRALSNGTAAAAAHTMPVKKRLRWRPLNLSNVTAANNHVPVQQQQQQPPSRQVAPRILTPASAAVAEAESESLSSALERVVSAAPGHVVSLAPIVLNCQQVVALVVASATDGFVVDLSGLVTSQPLPSELANFLAQPNNSSSSHFPVLKLVASLKQRRRLRKLLNSFARTALPTAAHSQSHPSPPSKSSRGMSPSQPQSNHQLVVSVELCHSVTCLSDRLSCLKPITAAHTYFHYAPKDECVTLRHVSYAQSIEINDQMFGINDTRRLNDSHFVESSIHAMKAFAAVYREHYSSYQTFHSFFERELASLPNFRFQLTPILPSLPLVSALDVAKLNAAYRRFMLPSSVVASLPRLKLTPSQTVTVVEATNHEETEAAIESFLQHLEHSHSHPHARCVVGFDTESRAVFRPNVPNHPISLLQLASDSHALLIRLAHSQHPKLPATLQKILMDPAIVKVGQGIGGDLKLLVAQYQLPQSVLASPSSHSFIDLSDISEPFSFAAPGLASLVAGLLGKSLSKAQQCSNWELRPRLTPAQIEYAALDAFVSKQLYHVLHELRAPVNGIMEKFAAANGWIASRLEPWLIKDGDTIPATAASRHSQPVAADYNQPKQSLGSVQ